MRDWWFAPLLAVCILIVFSSALPGTFFFDDFGLLLENPRVVSPTFDYTAFLEQYAGRPLTLWSFHWNYYLFGADPLSYHLVNLMLHIGVALLLWKLVQQFSGDIWLARLTALVFAIHPLQTQPVNYVWSRSMLLMGLFGLLSLMMIQKRPWLALLFFQLAIWSRSEALILLIPLMMLSRVHWKSFSGLASFNLVGFLYGMAYNAPAEVGWNHSNVVGFWISQPVVILRYLQMMFWPAGLSIDHHLSYATAPEIVVALLLLGLLAIAAYYCWSFDRRPVLAAGWIVLLLSPGLVLPNSVFLSESRSYLALAGFAFIAAWVAVAVPWRDRRKVALVVAGLSLLFADVSYSRNRLWNDELALWRDAASKAPRLDRVRYNLGFALVRAGEIQEAEREFEVSRNLNPADDYSYAALGYCAEVGRDWKRASAFYQHAVDLNPANAYARNGLLRVELNQLEEGGPEEGGVE